jgi:hypothetical protein
MHAVSRRKYSARPAVSHSSRIREPIKIKVIQV